MELNYIQEFIVLSRVLHFQEAADMLFISQSSLSKHIKSIETELGSDLFIRSKRGVTLSDFGKAWLPYATEIARIQRDYTTNLLEKNNAKQTATIGYIPLVTLFNFMPFFSEFTKKYPQYQYSFVQDSETNLMQMLRLKEVDFILTGNPVLPDNNYQSRFYTCDRLVIVLPQDHPLAVKDKVTLQDIRGETIISLKNTESLIDALERSDPTYHADTSIVVDKVHVMLNIIRKGLGVAILTNNMALHSKTEGVVIRELSPEVIYEIYMVFSTKESPSMITKAFATYLQEQ